MSVINKVLQDIERRTRQEKDKPPPVSSPVTIRRKNPKIIVIASVMVGILVGSIINFYILESNRNAEQQLPIVVIPAQAPQKQQDTIPNISPRQHLAQQQKVQESARKMATVTKLAPSATLPSKIEKTTAVPSPSKPVPQQVIAKQAKSPKTVLPPKLSPPTIASKKAKDEIKHQELDKQPFAREAANKKSSTPVLNNVIATSNPKKAAITNTIAPGKSHLKETALKPDEKTVKLAIKPVKTDFASLAKKSLKKAKSAQQSGRLAQARKLYYQSLELKRAHHPAREGLAALLFGQGSQQEAIHVLKQGVALYPQHEGYAILLAKVYYRQRKWEEALAVIPVISDNIEIQALRANLLQRVENYIAAGDIFMTLVHRQPSQPRWWLGAAIAFDKQGQERRAEYAYRQAVSLGGLSQQSQQFAKQRLARLE
ncbi:CDC27 family protein [Algicola sagamiensis]|uniref:CDC27 family protein n=1 Tax=Algicola sagamiensis TaxID=163869 RepID=UPI0012FCC47A|nr:CDC27 family protein [Algicola sagamiensis]